MKYKIFNSKKAIGIDDAVPLIIFLFIAAFVIVLFRINEKITEDRIANDIETQKEILDGNNALIDYLRETDSRGNTNADSIAKSHASSNYDNVKKDMQAYFEKKLSHVPAWRIEVVAPSGNFFVESSNYQFMQQKDEVAAAAIPVIGKETGTIQLALYFGKNPVV